MIAGRKPSRDARRREDRRKIFRRTTDPTHPRNRLAVVVILFSVFGAILAAQLIRLQAVRPEEYREEGARQRSRVSEIEAFRGRIVDRSGFVLASSTPTYQVVADPQLLARHDPVATARLLASVLDMDESDVLGHLLPSSPSDHYGLVARSVDQETALELEALADASDSIELMIGIFLESDEDRVYPAGELAKPLVGRVDPDEVGIFGIEKQFDDVMTGVAGFEEFEGGRYGSISSGRWRTHPAIAGLDVVLTIDHRIQYVAEKALLEHCEEVGAAGATAVLTEPSTGHVLAMASVSRADGTCVIPNHNKALVDWFEPGSVLKTVTAAAAIEELGYTPDTRIEVPPSIAVGDAVFHDDPSHPAAPFPLSEVLARSMNVGTITLAQRVGPDAVYEYQRRFGLGQPTGLGWPGETSGRLKAPEDWWGSEAGSIPIGQGITTSATQLVTLYNTIANDGHLQPIRLVEALQAPDESRIPIEAAPSKPVVSESTAEHLTELLTGVVTNGTGASASIDGYQVAGKTGTAWKVFDDGSGTFGYGSWRERRYVVTFAGFVPADDPSLSMVIVVDEPQTATTASAVAAPIFAEVGLYALQILGVAPDGANLVDRGRVRAPVVGVTDDGVASDGATDDGATDPGVASDGETDDEVAADVATGTSDANIKRDAGGQSASRPASVTDADTGSAPADDPGGGP